MNLKTMELSVVLKIIKNNIWWLIAIPTVSVALAFSISKYYIQPMYSSSAQIFITTNVKAEDGKSAVYSEQLKANIQLANTFNTILKSSRTLGKVRSELQLDETDEELSKKNQHPIR
ncbi:YveK family protein [Listeria cornellensis]|uniref:Putative capsular polysaccharide synthesis enzyme Cap5A n=1 Tax=Listeria cornellensis FSL F6-0969 TaxID=1265820 RepID=W7BZ47_9LIST|nr:Wzz/FepE/Etk N-terminal domain-containing protein [Listeria cornellensis]EUJ25558.1 putative capsular polysaccharide synthesis enzyme Cap5A [Listeria cornellensis FSL F6-0969]